MTDIVDPKSRSRMMSGIRGKNTKPELIIRRALHANGYRFRLHSARLPGRPDIVLPKYRTVILVHGCFWHRHAGCHYAATPATRTEFWLKKLAGNVARDRQVRQLLHDAGWRTIVVWECGLKHEAESQLASLFSALESCGTAELELPSTPPRSRQG